MKVLLTLLIGRNQFLSILNYSISHLKVEAKKLAKKIAFFVESYYRTPDPNGICVKAIADELTNQKNQVYVFTSKRGYRQPRHEIVYGVNINRFNRSMGYIFKNFGNYYNNLWGKIAKTLSRIILGLDFRFKCFIWPLNSITLIIKYIISAMNEYKRGKFDVVIGVYLHLEELLSAVYIKNKYPDVKLIIYTLDAMSGRPAPHILGSENITQKSILRWENYIFKKADVICVLESHRKHYDDPSYNNLRKKLKYMDIPTLKFETIQKSKHMNNITTLVYTGNSSLINGRDPLYLIEILKKVTYVEFHMYGAVADRVEQLILESGLLNKVVFLHGTVSHEETIKAQSDADFLVNLGSFDQTAIPSKIFEYIVQRKPIISFFKIDDDASIPYLLKYPDSLLIKEDKLFLTKNTENFRRFIHSNDHIAIDSDYLKKNYYNNTPLPMIDEILREM